VYVPSPAIVIDVFVQFGAVSTGDTPHNFTDDPTNVAPADARSFDNGFNEIGKPTPPDAESAFAVGGTVVVNETVLLALEPALSAITYVWVDVPAKPATLVNETTPVVVLTVYVPSPGTVVVVAVQFGAVSPVPHKRTELGVNVRPAGAVSFVAGFTEIGVPDEPVAVSGCVVGPSTVNDTELAPFNPRLSEMTYVCVPVPTYPATLMNVTSPVVELTV
jgi:hypothetical protein